MTIDKELEVAGRSMRAADELEQRIGRWIGTRHWRTVVGDRWLIVTPGEPINAADVEQVPEDVRERREDAVRGSRVDGDAATRPQESSRLLPFRRRSAA